MNQLRISHAAKKDLVNIYDDGIEIWGIKQSQAYLLAIKEKLKELSLLPKTGLSREDLLPNLRCRRQQSHIIYFRVEHSVVEIVRILHVRQDPARHL